MTEQGRQAHLPQGNMACPGASDASRQGAATYKLLKFR
jgi:hypothetical protein